MVQLPSHSPFLFSSDEKFHHKEGEVLSSVLKGCPKERKKKRQSEGKLQKNFRARHSTAFEETAVGKAFSL